MFNTKERTARRAGVGHHSRHVPPGALPNPSTNRHQNRHRSKSPHGHNNVQVNNQNNSPNRWGPRTSSTLPNPEIRHQAKVRVQAGAGDKCVAPVKSKQKRRQAVPGRPIDESTLSMDAVTWSEEVYTVEQLVHAYGGKLPVIAKVMHGCHDNAGFSLSVNQVVQCHSFNRQNRVKAHTSDGGGKITIPVDYPIQVFTQENGREERSSLSKLLEHAVLPVKTLVTSVDEDIEVSTVNVVGKHLTITDSYQEVFLRANTIHDGWIDQDGIYAIPASFDAAFSVAVGMRGATEDEWIDYYGMFSRSVRHLNFKLLSGYEGIIIEDDGGGTIKLQMPKNPTLNRITHGPVYENFGRSQSEKRSSTVDSRPSTSRQSHPYENWDKGNFQKPMMRSKSEKPRESRTPDKARPTTMDFEPPEIIINPGDSETSSRQDSQDGSRPEGQVKYSPRQTGFESPQHLPDLVSGQSAYVQQTQDSPRRPETPFSDADEEDVEDMFKSVLDVAEEQETLKRNNEERLRLEDQEMLFMKRREEEEKRKEKIRKQLEQRELQRVNSGRDQQLTDSARKHLQVQNAKNNENKRRDNALANIHETPVRGNIFENNRPSYRSSTSSRDSRDVDLISSVEVEVHRDPSPRTSTHISTRDKGVKTLTKQFEPPGGQINVNNNISSPSPLRKDKPNAIVPPTVQPQHVVTINVTNTATKSVSNGHLSPTPDMDKNAKSPKSPRGRNAWNSPKSQLNINSIDDVPKDLAQLTVEDVCKCLSLLNMDRHLVEFRKHQVDGNLLVSMKENVMTNDFKFTPFNASKLTRFIRGWRPKLT